MDKASWFALGILVGVTIMGARMILQQIANYRDKHMPHSSLRDAWKDITRSFR